VNSNVRQANARGYARPDVLLRTRRSVMEAAHRMQNQRARRRRHAGIALLVMAGLLVLFAPALWNVATDLSAGEHFFDMPVMILFLSLVLLSAMFAILMMTWRDAKRGARDE
jgi:cytochrome bd-type quinol oxidase subunit 2